MNRDLTPHEARVLGALIEKQITTPEQYPLSLNALTSACNQKSNRDPVMRLDERTVQDTLEALKRKYLAAEKSGFSSRVTKYVHRFGNTEFGPLQLSEQELGIMCVLLLRGPQTPGELRARTARMCSFADTGEVELALAGLAARSDGALVVRLRREPGKRESRYMHLLSGDVPGDEPPPTITVTAGVHPSHDPGASEDDRLAELERRVDALQEELAKLREHLAHRDG